jgi:hypothetical protein
MSQLRDTLEFQEATIEKFAQQDKRLAELERYAAVLDQGQKTINSQIEIFRTAINETFDRIRRELGIRSR